MKNPIKLCAAAVLLSALIVCSNPIDIVGNVTNEVKASNNKFLVIKGTGPFAANDQTVSPGTTIWVQFDRDLDTSTVTAQNITFAPAASWTSSYISATKTLTITPSSLESLTPYTLTLAGLKGTDGSELQSSYPLAFKTKQGPSGTMTINTGGAYTNIASATLYFSVNVATTQIRWSFTESDLTPDPFDAHSSLWQAKAPSISGVGLGADGPKTVYYQLLDVLNNTTSGYDVAAGTHPRSAAVVLDTVAPVVTSFSIENGALTAPSTTVTLYLNVTDPTSPVQMHFQNGAGAWSAWESYSATKVWTLSSPGTRLVTAEFQDMAGNVSVTKPSDSIIAGAPTMYAYMNYHYYATVGNTYEWWGITAPDVGTDTYHVSWRFHSGGSWNAWTTTTASNVTVATATGVVLDWAVQIENSIVGWAGNAATPYSNAVPNFTSNLVIIYNDGDSTDSSLANELQSVLQNSTGWVAANGVTGTMPSWSITLLPQSFLSTSYSIYNRVWGYPIIVTPGVVKFNQSAGWVQNVIGGGRGIIAMGTAGARMLDTINSNWRNWRYRDQQPSQIGYANSIVTASHYWSYARTAGNTVWTSPLMKTTLSDWQLMSIGNPQQRISASLGSIVPTGGEVYCADYTNTSAVNTVRQGRFLQYGYTGLAGDGFPGWLYPFWVNLVYRMSDAYYP